MEKVPKNYVKWSLGKEDVLAIDDYSPNTVFCENFLEHWNGLLASRSTPRKRLVVCGGLSDAEALIRVIFGIGCDTQLSLSDEWSSLPCGVMVRVEQQDFEEIESVSKDAQILWIGEKSFEKAICVNWGSGESALVDPHFLLSYSPSPCKEHKMEMSEMESTFALSCQKCGWKSDRPDVATAYHNTVTVMLDEQFRECQMLDWREKDAASIKLIKVFFLIRCWFFVYDGCCC